MGMNSKLVGWDSKNLGDLLSIKHGKSQKNVETENGLYPILGTGGEIGRSDSFLYSKPSVLIGRKGTIDRPVFMDSPFWTVDTLFYSEVKDENDPKFLFYLFQTIDWRSKSEASGVPSLRASSIESTQVFIPINKSEQKAIAETLSDVDELILISKIEKRKLEQLLAGKLTHLFSPHFQTKYHFEDTTIDELAFVIKGSARKYSDVYSPSAYPFVNGGINPSGYTDSFNCESGTVLVSEGGNSCGFVNFYKKRVWSGGHSYRVKAKNESIRAEYLYYLLKFNESRIMGLRVGSGLPNVQAKDLKALSLKNCKDSTYQEMVIQELDDITSLIENNSKILQEYEWIKQGMMNDLLTGKVRLV